MKPPIVAVLPAKRGRPRVKDPGHSVSTWLQPIDHDQLARLASEHEVSISALVRSLIILRLR